MSPRQEVVQDVLLELWPELDGGEATHMFLPGVNAARAVCVAHGSRMVMGVVYVPTIRFGKLKPGGGIFGSDFFVTGIEPIARFVQRDGAWHDARPSTGFEIETPEGDTLIDWLRVQPEYETTHTREEQSADLRAILTGDLTVWEICQRPGMPVPPVDDRNSAVWGCVPLAEPVCCG